MEKERKMGKGEEKDPKEELPTPGDTSTFNDVIKNAEGTSGEEKKAFLDAKVAEFAKRIKEVLGEKSNKK